jgi:hypothetical protein
MELRSTDRHFVAHEVDGLLAVGDDDPRAHRFDVHDLHWELLKKGGEIFMYILKKVIRVWLWIFDFSLTNIQFPIFKILQSPLNQTPKSMDKTRNIVPNFKSIQIPQISKSVISKAQNSVNSGIRGTRTFSPSDPKSRDRVLVSAQQIHLSNAISIQGQSNFPRYCTYNLSHSHWNYSIQNVSIPPKF